MGPCFVNLMPNGYTEPSEKSSRKLFVKGTFKKYLSSDWMNHLSITIHHLSYHAMMRGSCIHNDDWPELPTQVFNLKPYKMDCRMILHIQVPPKVIVFFLLCTSIRTHMHVDDMIHIVATCSTDEQLVAVMSSVAKRP